ncbi:DNA-binding NtrC family response regulator [Novosphingobium sp. 1529]|uniref:sigma-54-dependent transcriptional regulator n=1 Tax=Novosphingobium sp. 1529 TaxID=3156424 RepID=UPI0033976F22
MDSPTPPSSPPRVLLIDDDRDVHQAVAVLFGRAGIELVSAMQPEEAYSALELAPADAILLDLNFTRGRTHGEEGFAALARLLGDDADAAVVVITGHSGIRIAVAAMQAGAIDFVMKPWRNEELLERVRAALAHRQRRREIAALRQHDGTPADPPRLLGASAAIERVRDLVRRVGPTTANVLILGPAGSGRTLASRAIHHASPRAAGELVMLDARAAADPRDDVAAADIGRASGGTLLLRHVDRLAEVAQGRLLARLPADIRIVATADTAEPLIPALRARVGTVEIAMPPLAQRGADALLLARHFARAAERRHGKPVLGFMPEAETALAVTPWSDDVRGLAQAVERAVVLGDGGLISEADLGLGHSPAEAPLTAAVASTLNLEESERVLVAAALKRHGFNVSHAAEELGLSRAALYRRMAKHGL